MSPIEKHFNNLSEFLQSRGVPKWDTVLFAENLYVNCESKQSFEGQLLYKLIEFSDRFDSLIAEGHNWLNMTGLGLLGNTLIVAIEKPSSNRGSPHTSVNYSGPPHCVQENSFRLEKYIEIKE